MGEGCGLSPRTSVNPKGGDRVGKPAESHRAAQGGEEAAGASERHSVFHPLPSPSRDPRAANAPTSQKSFPEPILSLSEV